MPSPSFLTKAFIAGFLFGHLLVPAEKSWFIKLARAPAFNTPLSALSDSNSTSARNGPQRAQGADLLWHPVNDNPPVLRHSSPGNHSASSTPTPNLHLTHAHPSANHQPTLSPELPTTILAKNSDLVAYRPSTSQATVSTTLYYVYGLLSASARPPIPVMIPPHQVTGLGSFIQLGLTFRSLLYIFALLYHVILGIYHWRKPNRKSRKLPERAVSMVIANLQGDPQSLKACSLVSRSWTKESHRHLFHTISLNSEQSANLWFSPDSLSLAIHVRSIHLSMGAVAGAGRGLCRFPCVRELVVLDWRGSKHSLPAGRSPFYKTVNHLELVQPDGTPDEILGFISFFTSLESLYITNGHQRSEREVRATCAGDVARVSIRVRMLRCPPADGIGFTRPCSGNGISIWLRESG
jgi:hypothetical protein